MSLRVQPEPASRSPQRKGANVTIDLSLDDLDLLRTALSRHLGVLREELAHTDDRDYRHWLRENLTALEFLLERLTEAQVSSAGDALS